MDKERTTEAPHVESVTVSRRSVLQGVADVGGAVTLLAVIGHCARAAEAKTSKQVAGYRDSPNGSQSCSTCIAFVRPNTCRIVAGNVSPQGWCKIWQRKT
jgi:hypothetical protein